MSKQDATNFLDLISDPKSEKSAYCMVIHERICFLCDCFLNRRDKPSNFFSTFFEDFNFHKPEENLVELTKHMPFPYIKDLHFKEMIFLAFEVYEKLKDFYFNENEVSGFFTKSKSVSHTELIRSLFALEDFSKEMYAIRGIEHRKPIEKRSTIRATTSKAGKVSSDTRWGNERKKVIDLWDAGHWPTPPKAAEAIYQQNIENYRESISVRTMTEWIRKHRKRT